METGDESRRGRIRALHVTPWVSRKGGGVSTAMWGYVDHAGGAGWRATVAGVRDADLGRDTAGRGAPVVAGPLVGPASLAYSPGFGRLLREVEGDVVHVHGLRHWPGYAAGRVARRKDVSLVVSPHGGLYPQLLAVGRARKWVARPLDRANLRSAALVHATSGQEARYVRAYGVRAPIAVVGLGIDSGVYRPEEATGRRGAEATKGEGARSELVARWPELAGQRILLYLGFLHAKKGLSRIAEALARTGDRAAGWRLVLAGPDDGPDGARARAALAAHGQLGRTTFTGAVWDLPTKLALLRAADVLAMPSDWENFGIAIGEALACGTPVIASTTAPWGAVVERECGWWVDVGVEPLTAALADVVAKTPGELAEMGRRGRALIVERYQWVDRAREMGEAYAWACGRGERPPFVYFEGDSLPQ
ncbi:MAG TPA: glycosyltransferase [Tepidisphaeraceae bacterium]|nr:glycosyltransferase [Tepidisphaeraceae bacterium]